MKTWGVEFEEAYSVSDQLDVTGSVAWMDGEAVATPGAAPTQHLVPPLTAVIGLAYEVPDRDLTLRATSAFVGAANVSATASVAVANTVPLELFTGPGRNIALTLDVRF